MATKKTGSWDGVKNHEFGFTIGQSGTKELMGNQQPKPGPKIDLNITIKKTKFAAGGQVKKQNALTPKQQKKVAAVMKEFKAGELHSGKGGKVVKNPKQGIAIALSEASRLKKKK